MPHKLANNQISGFRCSVTASFCRTRTHSTPRQKFSRGFLCSFFHTPPYVLLRWKKVNKFWYLESTISLTPTERVQEKKQNERATACLIKSNSN